MKIANFQQKVFNLAKKIPKGRVTTYKEIAKALNCRVYRAVGNALNKNKSKDVPCHRVVKSNGAVGGFAGGVNKKMRLLKEEGIAIRDRKINLNDFLFREF